MSKCVAVDVHSLIIGRETSFPIYDVNGVLLLAAGKQFTRENKLKIIERGINKVIVDETDAEAITVKNGSLASKSEPSGELNKRVAEKLESLIRSGVMNVRNSNSSLRSSIVQHGRKNYDKKQLETLAGQHAKSIEHVGGMLQDVVDGAEIDGEEVSDLTDGFITSLTLDISQTLSIGLLKNQDPTLAQHSLNVAILAMAIGIEMGFDRPNVRLIGMAGLLQDLGMAFVPKEIREAARPLTQIEFLEIQKHPIRTANILQKMPEIPDLVTLITYQSHERPDGSGYPRGRDKKNIHLFARILQVADSYTAMTVSRPYSPPMMAYAAMETMIRQAKEWRVDPPVVRDLLHVLSLFPIGSYVTLSDGAIAQVIRSNGEQFTRPIVLVVQDKNSDRVDRGDESAVIDLRDSDLSVIQALPTPGSNEVRFQEERYARTAKRRRSLPAKTKRCPC